ncbi:hypothetical protein Tco_1480844, partial [Tanacetum coccineum]
TYAPKTTARKGPPKELLKWDGITDKDISQFQVAAKHSKLKGYTSQPLKVLGLASAHTWACIGNKTFGLMRTFLNFKSQQNIPSQKVPPPSHKRFHLKATKGLASAHTWACISNKTFGLMRTFLNFKSQQNILSQKVPPPSHKRFHLKATKVPSQKFVPQKVPSQPFHAKSLTPIRNCILGLASTHTWACIDNKTFGIGKPIDEIITDQDSKGKKEG